MRYLVLVLGLIGLFVLYCFFFFRPLSEGIEEFPIHTAVTVSGLVTSERVISSDFRILQINNISVSCSCSSSYLNRRLYVIGMSDSYRDTLQVRALRIYTLS